MIHMIRPKGVIPPMIVPFKNNDIDVVALKQFVDWLIDQGVDGLFPISTTGEGWLMNINEKKKVIDTVVDAANGRVPVFPGALSVKEEEVLEIVRYASDAGADAVVIHFPKWVDKEEKALSFYEKVTTMSKIPIILYYSKNLRYKVSVETIVKLSKNEKIVGIKDSSYDVSRIGKLIVYASDNMSIIQGSELLYLPSLAIGIDGVIGGGLNIHPRTFKELEKSFQSCRHDEAKRIHARIIQIWDLISYAFPLSGKVFLNRYIGIPFGRKCKKIITYSEKELNSRLEKVSRLVDEI